MIEVRLLGEHELELADSVLPLHRLGGAGEYLVAWDGKTPIGHAYLAWAETELGVPEIQDVFVLPERRREGVATALTQAAEQLVAERGHDRCSLSVGVENDAARRLYEGLGYANAASRRSASAARSSSAASRSRSTTRCSTWSSASLSISRRPVRRKVDNGGKEIECGTCS